MAKLPTWTPGGSSDPGSPLGHRPRRSRGIREQRRTRPLNTWKEERANSRWRAGEKATKPTWKAQQKTPPVFCPTHLCSVCLSVSSSLSLSLSLSRSLFGALFLPSLAPPVTLGFQFAFVGSSQDAERNLAAASHAAGREHALSDHPGFLPCSAGPP